MKNRFAVLAVFALLVGAVALSLSAPAEASTCDVTEFPSSGTLTAERLNQRVRQTERCLNGNVGNANWNASEPLQNANLAAPNAIYAVSWSVLDEDGDATAGEDVCGGTSCTNARMWRAPVASTIVGMSVALRCQTGTCASASVTVNLQVDSTTVKTFSGLNTESVNTDMGLSSAVTTTNDLNVDLSGTFTDVDAVDIVVYLKAVHQT